jgi:alpha-tubulin suppressor-like RCC1 family protein
MIHPVSSLLLRRPLSSFIFNSSRAGSLSCFAVAGLLALSQAGNAAVAIVPAVVAGEADTFVVRKDGSVWATGDNTYGELGDGTTVSKSTPIQVMTGVAAVSAGFGHTLFLKTDGTVWAVGKNDFGQLGDGTLVNKTTPVKVNTLAGVTAISAGGNMSLFLASTGVAYASGYTGNSVTPTRTTPAQMTTSVTAIAAGGGTSVYQPTGIDNGHGLFLRTNGSVLAFGDNDFGQLGDGLETPVTRSALVAVSNTTRTGNLTGVTAIAAGAEHSLFMMPDGSALAVGSNEFGQIGVNDAGSSPGATNFYYYTVPWKYVTSGVTGIAAGGLHSFTVKSGVVLASGRNDQGQLGDGLQGNNRFIGFQVISGVSGLAAGGSHSIFLKTTGDILTTGANDQGQLGNGLTTGTLVPTSIGNINPVAQTITFTSPGNQVLSSPTVTLTATASPSNLPVTYSITSGPATVLDSTLTLTGAGSVVVTANQAGNFKYAAATAVSRTITVSKGVQTLTFTLPATIPLSSSPVTLAASSNAGLAVTYSVVSGPATVSGSTLTLTGTGAVTVRASQAGDANWLAASDADATFTVTPAEATGIEAWAAAAGLTGDDALATSIPFHDGVTNLAKYSFNMNGAAADNSLMTTGGSSGLPLVELDRSGADPVLRVTFVRRKGTTLVYTAQRSSDLASFTAMAATPVVTSIDDTWERVKMEETISTSTAPVGFARVQVELP